MWVDGQRLDRNEVELWIQQAYTFPYFKASVIEREEPERSQVRIIITITGPNAERIVAKDRTAVYYSVRAIPGMPQIDSEFVA